MQISLDNSVGLLADGEDTVKAVVVVNHLLHLLVANLDLRDGDVFLLGRGRVAHISNLNNILNGTVVLGLLISLADHVVVGNRVVGGVVNH